MKFLNNKYIYSILVFIFLYYAVSTITKPTFELIIDSNVKSELQIFYKTINGAYSEEYVYNKNIVIGQNNINLKLPSYSSPLRIDISNSEFKIKIKSISLNYLFYEIPLKVDNRQMYQINSIIENKDKSIEIDTVKNALDPQIFFLIDDKHENIFFIKFVLTILIFIFLFFIKLNFIKIKKIILNVEKSFINFNNYITTLNIDFSKFYIYFLIGFVFHIFEISNFLISVDDEYSAFRIIPEAWVWDGRWTGFLIEKFIFDQPTIPFIPNIMSCILMAMSYIILLKVHNIKSDWKTYFLFPIFSAFPTLWMINEFYGNMVMVAFGFLLVSLSTIIFVELEKYLSQNKFSTWKRIKLTFYPSLVLSIGVGTYQSFLMLGIALFLGIFILRLFRNEIINKVQYFINGSIYIIFGLILYILINIIFKTFFPSDYNYIGGFIKIENIDVLTILNFVYYEIVKVYIGSSDFFGLSINSLGILVLMIFCYVFFHNKNRFLLILSLILLLISPFLLHFLSGGNLLPTRSMVALPYVIWFFALLSIINTSYIKNILGIIILGFLLIQQSSALGQYAAATNIIQSQDKFLAFDLYKRISEVNSNFNPEDTHYVDIYGYKSIETIYPSVPTSTINSSFFDWDAGNMSRMISFMRLIGYSNIKMVNKEIIEKDNIHFSRMPSYPNKGSVEYIDGVYLIKLGSKPDVYRR
jgi:hypothetical protein